MHIFLSFDQILTVSRMQSDINVRANVMKVFSEAKESGGPSSFGGNAI